MGFLSSRRKIAETAEKNSSQTKQPPKVEEEIPLIEEEQQSEPVQQSEDEPVSQPVQSEQIDEETLISILKEHEQRIRNLEQKITRLEAVLSQRII